MTKAPKRPSQRDDLKQRNDEDGALRSQTAVRKPRRSPKRKTETVLDPLDTKPSSGIMEGPGGSPSSGLLTAQDGALTTDRDMSAGDAETEQDWRDLPIEIGDGPKPLDQTVASEQTFNRNGASQVEKSSEARSNIDGEGRAQQEQEPFRPQSDQRNLALGQRRDVGKLTRNALVGQAQRVIGVWSPRLRTASGRVKVWTRDVAMRPAESTHRSKEPFNPVYLLAGITLGIPALLLVPLIGMNPGIQAGFFTTVVTFLAVSAFVVAAIFEIKRIADQRADKDHP